ncbi:MAG: arginine deiminase family protein [Saprospiraceae bacterium]
MPIQVSSEIGRLKKVIVHRPDEGIARISPKRAEELLFDDIVHLPQMQEEHDVFTGILEAFVGKGNVLETRDLVEDCIKTDPATTRKSLTSSWDTRSCPKAKRCLLQLCLPTRPRSRCTDHRPHERIHIIQFHFYPRHCRYGQRITLLSCTKPEKRRFGRIF